MKAAASIIRWIPITIVAFAVVALVALLQLDTIVNETLYLYGLNFDMDWAVPYWNTIRTALAMVCLTLIVAIVVQISMVFYRPRKKNNGPDDEGSRKENHWNTYKLSDGSTIRIKTILKGVKRLNTYTAEGKPAYAVKADNIVEIVDAPKQLLKPSKQET